ncbi:MAG: uroporphyrinogen-III C-methyltransferase [Anaerolineae bacterium]|nr:uroporphyrinogen-III C-methyltransferase [Anaerolineae bacterium]
MTDSRGFVSLIGAGPGDPGLLTLAGAEALAAADVVVYDYLANPALLAHARPEAEQIYVGKKAGQHTLSQEEINALLVERARAGQRLARLKGGDPFVFGRGGEEALALVEAGLPFEVIPGVTSAVAAPAYAGIPVTHRGLSSSFAVITGHEDPAKEESAIDWPHLATAVDTLVFLMGVGNLPKIVDQLSAHGRPPETPVALVRWGTMPDQQTVSGTLADIVARVEAAGLRPPAVAVVGLVAGLRQQLRWFEDRRLFGQRVLVTRTREQASVLSARLRALGAEAIELPTIRIAPPADWRELDRAIAALPDYDWIVFTSTNGVAYFWQRLLAAGQDARALHGIRLATIGPATAAALKGCGLQAEVVPDEYVAEAVAAGLGAVRGQRVLLPRADIARPALAELLREAGAEVIEVSAYRTLQPKTDPAELRATLARVTVATFTSSSTVRNLATMAREAGLDLGQALAQATIACIGPITAGTAREEGLPVHVVADEYTIDGLVEALVQDLPARLEV